MGFWTFGFGPRTGWFGVRVSLKEKVLVTFVRVILFVLSWWTGGAYFILYYLLKDH